MQPHIKRAVRHSLTQMGTLQGLLIIGLVSFLVPLKVLAAEQASISIIVPTTHDRVVDFAAHDLRDYLKQLTGEPIAIGSLATQHHIYLGEIPANFPEADAASLRGDVEKLQEDGFVDPFDRGGHRNHG